MPIELLDVAGLVPGAHQGKGLGNKFLDDLRHADALIHVVDVSGTTDAEGEKIFCRRGAWKIVFLRNHPADTHLAQERLREDMIHRKILSGYDQRLLVGLRVT